MGIIKRNSGLSSAAHFAKQKTYNYFCFCKIRNPAAAKARRAEGGCGGNSAAPELQNSAFGFFSKKVRTSFKNDRCGRVRETSKEEFTPAY
ncbi:MAG: hypothetical protein A2722_03705 [Candidatus Doudnabacteria bacterium RIFCSPHIGHO2_01_FULL_50_11]|uniref:Uncharacterized protein n=1 Tax=Candidatus Doudnabacteria bacterium RIFCSPHIGHO2_01_FULL_50_11 TaxID=1817828 RepID=A0A1F5PIX6_9BACT|nr:MAG: hypothetical protein A2722_03705 [Candidatus Doudnabacteria bacterium RIFCSPHIGHO2_01_FULL_50_11]